MKIYTIDRSEVYLVRRLFWGIAKIPTALEHAFQRISDGVQVVVWIWG